MSSAVDPVDDVLETYPDAGTGDSYSTTRYTETLATCPMDGTILGAGTQVGHADRECPACHRIWRLWEVFGR